MNNKGKLYLIPNLIAETEINQIIPLSIQKLVLDIKYYIVENTREARRYLKKLNPQIVVQDLIFYELDKHSNNQDIESFLTECNKGNDTALMSDAGLPCIADPGNNVVKMAHKNGIRIIPCAGASSIFMALMASGLNGQNFAFNGYLPIDQKEKINKLKILEKKSSKENQSQIFMDTPYRNNKLLEDIISSLNPDTYLCIASNISGDDEFINTKQICEWQKIKINLNKKPCIFII